MTQKEYERFYALSSSNVSDALDALGLLGSTYGVRPVYEGCPKLVGEALTVKIGPTGETPMPSTHLCAEAIAMAKPGNVIVVDNSGDTTISAWGGLLANAARSKGVNGVVVDGAVRDVDDFYDAKFPVFARSAVVRTSRGRIMVYETNGMIQFAGVQVRPGDIIVGDRSGVTVVPKEHYQEVLAKAEELEGKESNMMQEVGAGGDMLEVDAKYDYVHMLKK